MKTTLLLIFALFISIPSMAAKPDMTPVTSQSSPIIKDYASGVCSVGFNESGTDCCTGFRIADNLIMTNFHCLVCAHSLFKALHGSTPRFMEPSRFLYSFPKDKPIFMDKIKKYIATTKLEIDVEKLFIPSNDAEFKTLLNTYPDLFTRINFKNTIDAEATDQVLLESSLQIKEVMAMNLTLDYSILRVEGMDASQKVFKLSDQPIVEKQELAIIGHPSKGPYPNKKVYDTSRRCKVIDPLYTEVQPRVNVFTHQCDTAPGSSGSPIIDQITGTVVGIHWGANDDKKVRFGIEMKSIVEDYNKAQ